MVPLRLVLGLRLRLGIGHLNKNRQLRASLTPIYLGYLPAVHTFTAMIV